MARKVRRAIEANEAKKESAAHLVAMEKTVLKVIQDPQARTACKAHLVRRVHRDQKVTQAETVSTV